jgi:DNA-binding MarR family transcriptional regulator
MMAQSTRDTARPVPGLVQSLARVVAIRLRHDLADHDMVGVRPLHAPLLMQLLGGGRRAADLAETAGVSRQAMAQVVATLERDGYIKRIADPGDSRAKLVCLTARGRAALRLMRTSNLALEDEWRARVGDDRLRTLSDILTDLLLHFNGGAPDGPSGAPR